MAYTALPESGVRGAGEYDDSTATLAMFPDVTPGMAQSLVVKVHRGLN